MQQFIKTTFFTLLGCATALMLMSGHHFESDMAKKFPHFDLEDLFVFPSTDMSKTVFVLDFNPQAKKDSANFSDKGIYKFHIAGKKDFSEGLTISFTYKNGKVQLYHNPSPQTKTGTTGTLVAEGDINRINKLSNGITFWTGSTRDNFQGNALGIRDFKDKLLNKEVFDLSAFDVGEKGNLFGGLVSSVMAIEIPNKLLPQQIHYYASSEVEEAPDHWHPVNRIGYVLFPHLYLVNPELQYKYANSEAAETDPALKKAVVDNIFKFAKGAGIQKDPQVYAEQTAERIYPDIVPYTVGTKATYTIQNINGRPLQADAMNTALGIVIGSETPVDDQVSVKNEIYQDSFPYVKPIDQAYTAQNVQTINVANQAFAEYRDAGASNKENEGSCNNEKSGFRKILVPILIVLILILIIRRRKRR